MGIKWNVNQKKYNLMQIKDIIDLGIDYELSEEVLLKIKEISEKVGAPEYIKTPQFLKTKKNKKLGKLEDSDWEKIRNFTISKKEIREGINLKKDKIRKILNKITMKTLDEQ